MMLLLSDAKKLRNINHHKMPENKPPLTGTGMSLDQVKYTNISLPAFTVTDDWLKQPKMLPSPTVVECQKMKMHQPPQNT